MWGIHIDSVLGAEIVLEGYDEVNGQQHVLIDEPLFNFPKNFTFPPECIELDDGGDVTISPPPPTSTKSVSATYSTPHASTSSAPPSSSGGAGSNVCQLDNADNFDDSVLKRTPTWLMGEAPDPVEERAVDSTKGTASYKLTCDSGGTHPLYKWSYPDDPLVSLNGGAPIAKPFIDCTTFPCPTSSWSLTVFFPGSLPTPSTPANYGAWATEHVYELNWIREYLDYLYDNYFSKDFDGVPSGQSAKTCKGLIDVISKNGVTYRTDEPTPPADYSQGLMTSLGTDENFAVLTTVFTQNYNRAKYSVSRTSRGERFAETKL